MNDLWETYSQHFPANDSRSSLERLISHVHIRILSFGLSLHLLFILASGSANLLPDDLALLFIFVFINMFLAVGGLAILRTSRWLKRNLKSFWERATPPFEWNLRSNSRDQNVSVADLYVSDGISPPSKPDGDLRSTGLATFIHFLTGLLLVIAGALAVELIFSTPVLESLKDGVDVQLDSLKEEIPLISAAVSILMGRIVGLLFLSAVYISSSIENMVLILFLVIFPMVSLLPSAYSLNKLIEQLYFYLFTPEPDEKPPFSLWKFELVMIVVETGGISISVYIVVFV